jgi:hypothetical protein
MICVKPFERQSHCNPDATVNAIEPHEFIGEKERSIVCILITAEWSTTGRWIRWW